MYDGDNTCFDADVLFIVPIPLFNEKEKISEEEEEGEEEDRATSAICFRWIMIFGRKFIGTFDVVDCEREGGSADEVSIDIDVDELIANAIYSQKENNQ
jgi:hypothetical protein